MSTKHALLICVLFFNSVLLFAQVNSVNVQLLAEGFTSPVAMVEAPDGSGRLFVVDQIGEIKIIQGDSILSQPFLDIKSNLVPLMPGFDERGLLALAFHPAYAENGRFFVFYNAPLRDEAPDGYNSTVHISEFTVSADSNTANPASERILLQIDKPQFNHNGGTIAFGPDNYLYISIGDGGGGNDNLTGHVEDWYEFNAGGNGQDIDSNLLGSILRIDVDGGDPYGIPADNPFITGPGLDEIYAYGFRNPYRFSFDMGGANQLYVGDAGQELYEEVSIVERGGNYGWNVKEGIHCFDAANPNTPPAECPDTADNGDLLIDPVIEFENSKDGTGVGLVVIGGYVYRGTAFPELEGKYIFGTWTYEQGEPEGLIFSSEPQDSGLWSFDTLSVAEGELNHFVLGFAQDMRGEVYVLTSDSVGPSGNSGKVYKLSSSPTAVNDTYNPIAYALYQNYPNPFNPSTTIKFRLPEDGIVSLKLFDVLGREITTLINEQKPAGLHTVIFDASGLSSGVYFYTFKAGDFTKTMKMILTK